MGAGDTNGLIGFVDLSVKASKELDQALREHVRLEQCRSYRQFVVFLLEVMDGVIDRKPLFRLRVKQQLAPRKEGQIRAAVPAALYRSLCQKADNYGMEIPELTRVLLEMGLYYHQKFVPTGEVAGKEELISVIIGEEGFPQAD